MKASVIIATYNRHSTLRRTIPALAGQRCPAENLEVIVVVDGSSDGSSEYLQSIAASSGFEMRVVVQENIGQFAALNRGARCAKGDILIFLDDDCVCDPDLVQEHIRGHEARPGQDVVIGATLPSEDSPASLPNDMMNELELAGYERLVKEGPGPGDMMLCANGSVSRLAFQAAGGFDEHLLRNSDIEIGIRLAKMGLGVKFCAGAIVRQIYTKSDRQIIDFDARHGGAAELAIARRHPAYKPRSGLARLGSEPWWIARQIVGRLPVAPEPFLRVLYRAVEPFRSAGWARAAGVKLLRARMACAFYRSAVAAAGSWQALEAEFGKRLPVLMYHHIGELRRGAHPELTTTVRDFESQIRWLARRGYTSIKVSDWLAWCVEGKPLPARPVLLTFDDAYEETAEHALPILRANGFTAAAFMVATDFIGDTNIWDEQQGRPSFAIMNKEQILRQFHLGVEYGAHSCSHAELTRVSDVDLQHELQGSRDLLAAILGCQVRCFAYPYGDHDRRVRQGAAVYFDMAFTTEQKINHLASDPHRLGRILFLPSDSSFGMWCRVRLGWSPLPRLLKHLERRFSGLLGWRRVEQQV